MSNLFPEIIRPPGGSLHRYMGPAAGLMFILALGILTACGYRFAGRGSLPGDIERISVKVLNNRSSETGVETSITSAIISELNRRRQGSVVDPAEAQAILDGSIDSITWDTVSRKGVNTASERRVYATLSLAMTDLSGKVLWKRSGLRAEQAYAVVDGDKPATESNRRQAIGLLAQRLAETVYRRLTDQF